MGSGKYHLQAVLVARFEILEKVELPPFFFLYILWLETP
jgi:hypothetical protein